MNHRKYHIPAKNNTSDPICGSGVMLLAFANTFKSITHLHKQQ